MKGGWASGRKASGRDGQSRGEGGGWTRHKVKSRCVRCRVSLVVLLPCEVSSSTRREGGRRGEGKREGTSPPPFPPFEDPNDKGGADALESPRGPRRPTLELDKDGVAGKEHEEQADEEGQRAEVHESPQGPDGAQRLGVRGREEGRVVQPIVGLRRRRPATAAFSWEMVGRGREVPGGIVELNRGKVKYAKGGGGEKKKDASVEGR